MAAPRTRLYHNQHDGTFADVTEQAHMNRVCHTMGHNYGDLDNDGWLDFYCGTGDPDFTTLTPNHTFRNALFLNPGNTNHWLKLKLVGPKANRPAIGARIKVALETPAPST